MTPIDGALVLLVNMQAVWHKYKAIEPSHWSRPHVSSPLQYGAVSVAEFPVQHSGDGPYSEGSRGDTGDHRRQDNSNR